LPYDRRVKRLLCVSLALFGAASALGAAPDSDARPPTPMQLVVLDVELTGDLGGPELAEQHRARLKNASARLRENLSRTGLYRLVDTSSAQDAIDALEARHLHLHDCNGCDLEIGRLLGADQIFLAWVDRVSALILTLSYEIHDVKTGQISARKSFSFRGDTETAWTRAIDYMVRDLQESLAPRSTDPPNAAR
jgi:hypothetical protein